MAQATKLSSEGLPIWLVELEHERGLGNPGWGELFGQIDPALNECRYRCVGIEKLTAVLTKGVDVEPTDSVIFAALKPHKAFEYGAWPKIMLCFDDSHLKPIHKEIPATTGGDEIAELRKTFPTMLKSEDGNWLWLSRLPEGDGRLTKDYETIYGRYIPGDPRAALKAIFICCRPEDEPSDWADKLILKSTNQAG